MQKYYVLVGNPGSGKSITGNAALGKLEFKSGVAQDGASVTKAPQWCKSEELGGIVVDVPGLAEVKSSAERATQIEEAFKRNGIYKVFFVLRPIDGRLVEQDTATMKSIVDACPTMRYTVILTQVSPGPEMQAATTSIVALLQTYFPQLQNAAGAYHIVPEFPEARGAENILLPAEQQTLLRTFMMNAPESKIMSADVGKIKSKAQELTEVKAEIQKSEAQALEDKAKQEADVKQAAEAKQAQEAQAAQVQQQATDAVNAQAAAQQQVQAAEQQQATLQANLQAALDESSDDDDCVIL